MKYKGLVDPKDKPFGRSLPFEVQVKIMLMTNEKRQKVNQEIRLLPKCDWTGFPQILGEDLWWNQVLIRWHVARTTGCHHCHRMLDHKLPAMCLWWNIALRSFFVL